jgi:purine nucleosidase
LNERTVHGSDGLGDTGLTCDTEGIEVESAVDLAASLIETGGLDYLIATGPLTNIANIIKRIPDISKKIKGIYIMGGAISVEGNMTPYAEFNIYNDPEAASIVFESNLPKTIVSLDVTRSITLNEDDLSLLHIADNRLSKFICDIASYSIEYNKNFRGLPGASLHDPICVAIAANESACSYKRGRFDIVLDGIERGSIKEGGNPIRYCASVNTDRFKETLLTGLTKMIKESQK